ncbi:P-loop NTPase family protein [Roseobacter weihaiensis]|uniref:AAA family ATPase n=1 Tax=Roseobacter weihaiensis TaxID=2763262 RepID=UPI001D0B5D4A|nr:AAA family ATPase [Roseobacter sp. H9]
MQRVMIVGGSGSGKSTLARFLGQQTGLPVRHMDQIQWLPGWVSRPRSERIEMAHAVERGAAWIFEGNFSSTVEHRAARADTLVWLDLPVGLRLWRVTWRLLRYYGQERPDMAVGCTEGIHGETWPFYRWIWNTRQTHRVRFQNLIAGHPHLDVHHLTSRAEVAGFMRNVSETS